MTRRPFAALALTLSLAACATPQLMTAAQINEKADTTAALIYAAVATSINAYEAAMSPSDPRAISAEATKLKAWNDYRVAHAAYIAGQTVIITALQQDQVTAGTLTGKPVTITGPVSQASPQGAVVLAEFLAPEGH